MRVTCYCNYQGKSKACRLSKVERGKSAKRGPGPSVLRVSERHLELHDKGPGQPENDGPCGCVVQTRNMVSTSIRRFVATCITRRRIVV